MRITFVKKILANGEPCAKCADVEARLMQSGQMSRIDHVVVADERDPDSEGMLLAAHHEVATAPFFIVEGATASRGSTQSVDPRTKPTADDSKTTIYTVYLRFVRDVFGARPDTVAEAREAMRANPDLGLI